MAKTKGFISQEILKELSNKKDVVIDKQSSRFWTNVYRQLFLGKALKERAVKDAFYYLRRKNLITGEFKNNKLYIRLTGEGKKEVEKYKVDWLKIFHPKRWDKKWRLVVIDIPENKVRREVFLTKLGKLGFQKLQTNLWLIPFPCEKEINILRDYFNLNKEMIRLIEAKKLEGDESFKQSFKLGK